ncbi:MAG: hypothetical protein VW349_10575 [Gammaproteobacteria bacterium]|jgi:hypothetical protein
MDNRTIAARRLGQNGSGKTLGRQEETGGAGPIQPRVSDTTAKSVGDQQPTIGLLIIGAIKCIRL